MDKYVKSFLEDTIEIEINNEYDFRKLCGFTFVFKREIVIMQSRISSASINPVGIIYEENGEYYLAPLDKTIEIDEIIKEYVKVI